MDFKQIPSARQTFIRPVQKDEHPQTTVKQEAKKLKPKNKLILTGLIVLVVLSLAAAGFFFYRYQQIAANPSSAVEGQTKVLIDQVGKLLTLPSGEQPTIATVSDPSKLKDQPFFASAAKDDKLLIYTNAKKAIIYRPSTNKIINVGPIAISSAGSDQEQKK